MIMIRKDEGADWESPRHENKTPIVTLIDDGLNCRNAKVISPYPLHHQFSMLRLP